MRTCSESPSKEMRPPSFEPRAADSKFGVPSQAHRFLSPSPTPRQVLHHDVMYVLSRSVVSDSVQPHGL